jgi:hypothetical protein
MSDTVVAARAATSAAPQSALVSDRARAIIAGLLKSGRARRVSEGQGRRVVDARGFVSLVRLSPPGLYRVHRSGNVVLAGDDVVDVQPLQAGFIEAMARLGEKSLAS